MTGAPPDDETRPIQLGILPTMAVSFTHHRWTLEEYLLAWEVGALGKRVELLDGEVWDVGMGPWHGDTAAEIYAEAGYRVYWVVTQEGVHVHSEPTPTGYVTRVLYRPGQQVPVPYADGVTLDVSRLIGA